MRIATILALTVLCLSPEVLNAQAPAQTIVAQAQPVRTWLAAVKSGNQEQLQTVFSQAMRRQFEREGWDTAMMAYQRVFRMHFGDYELEDFSYEYTGDAERGGVSIVYKGVKLPTVRVVREGAEWKVDER